MSKGKCEAMKVTVDTETDVQNLIVALIYNYDIYIKRVRINGANYFEVSVYER